MADQTWDQTAEGQNVTAAWGYFQDTYQNDLPSLIDQLSTLEGRSL